MNLDDRLRVLIATETHHRIFLVSYASANNNFEIQFSELKSTDAKRKNVFHA